jgi:hypothetical protein
MKEIIKQIRLANENGLYYVALLSSLTLPDICGAIESNNGISNREKYKKWFDKYIAPKYNGNFDGETCYYFRCSMLHQGTTQHHKNRYSKIIFVEPNENYYFHNNIINDALNIDVKTFCEDICCGVEKWLQDVSETENFKKNISKLIKRYPNGLSPYIVRIPVIA